MTALSSPSRLAMAAGMALALSAFALAGCIPAAPEPTPVPTPTPTPTPTPPPSPSVIELAPTAFENWMDATVTPGDWTYRDEGSVSHAEFRAPEGNLLFAMRCLKADRQVALLRSSEATSNVEVRIRTETQDRELVARPMGGANQQIVLTLPARDNLLDAMAFSKGRFAFEAAEMSTLYIPSWPEVTRVVEDCRG